MADKVQIASATNEQLKAEKLETKEPSLQCSLSACVYVCVLCKR